VKDNLKIYGNVYLWFKQITPLTKNNVPYIFNDNIISV